MTTSFLLTLLPLREKVDRALGRETEEGYLSTRSFLRTLSRRYAPPSPARGEG